MKIRELLAYHPKGEAKANGGWWSELSYGNVLSLKDVM